MAYYVGYSDCTPDEPSSGWYYSSADEDGGETVKGPFSTRSEALDDESDGAYSEWLEQKREGERDLDRELIDAGRGHLVRR